MVSLRKASAYTKKHVVPFTRISKQKSKSYIKTVPPQKIVKFSMGDSRGFRDGKFPHYLTLVSEEKAQVRHNALEACRQYINRKADDDLGGQFFFRVIPFPHHIQRENKMLTGAGADRMQTGMQLSFGKTTGKAAIVHPGSKIFFIALQTPKAVLFMRNVLNEIRSKLPCKMKILYEDNSKTEFL